MIKDEIPQTVITGNFGNMYHYKIVGYLTEEPDTYASFDVFVGGDSITLGEVVDDSECINLGEVLADETDALLYFINWVAHEIEDWKKTHRELIEHMSFISPSILHQAWSDYQESIGLFNAAIDVIQSFDEV